MPEIGDHVMLGFRYNDPNRPLVIGSLFNGTTGAGGLDKNHIKSIFTRGGSTITFNEIETSILVKDPSGNTWFMDGDGNISVTAPKTFSVDATDIIMTASQNVIVSAGMNISENAGLNHSSFAGSMIMQNAVADYSLMAANIMEVAQGERKSKAKVMNENSSEHTANTEGKTNVHAQKNIHKNSGEKSNFH